MYGLPDLVVVRRISKLPVVRSTLDSALDFYTRMKKSSRIVRWSVTTAETSVVIAVDLSKPAIVLFDGPIHLFDEILCKSLDMVEDALPVIKKEPKEIYLEAKNIVNSVMGPVLKRADSVKELSIQSAITYSTKAAQSLDNALTVADGYVNKYLPEIEAVDQTDMPAPASPVPQTQTEKTIRHVKKFSKTLNRRLTQRTLYEARELRKQGVNLIHVLVQLTDLLARDPKAFARKMKELWLYLSEDEPENQAPPQTLEQLIVMLSRESARRVVHIVNFTTTTTVNIPRYAKEQVVYALHKFDEYVQGLNLKSTGIKRQYHIMKNVIKDSFGKFFSIFKPLMVTAEETKQSIQMSSKSQSKNSGRNAHAVHDVPKELDKSSTQHTNKDAELPDQANGSLVAK